MKKIIIISLSVLIVILGLYLLVFKSGKEETSEPSILTFKEEYEEYNGKSTDEGYYPLVEIHTNIDVEYINQREFMAVLKDKNGVIYIGNPTCLWSRNALPILLNALENNDITKFYYLDSTNLNDDRIIINALYPEEESIISPTVVFVRDGIVIAIHTKTIPTQTDPYIPLSLKEKEELNDIYNEGINKVFGISCNEEC